MLIVYASMARQHRGSRPGAGRQALRTGITDVALYDVSNTHVSYLIAESFKYSHIVLASVTYNLGIYLGDEELSGGHEGPEPPEPHLRHHRERLLGLQVRDLMQAFIDEELKNMTVLNERLSWPPPSGGQGRRAGSAGGRLVESLQEDLEN